MARGGASLIRIMIEAVDTATKLNNSATYGGNRGLSVKTPQRRMNSSHLKGATRRARPGGFDELCSLMHDGVNRDDPDENSAEFTVAVEVLEPAKVEVEPGRLPVDVGRQVLALHYPWYGSPEGPSLGWVHWQPPFTEDSIGSSTHYPLLGPYDSLDASLVEAQV
jgi:hypothetical protein